MKKVFLIGVVGVLLLAATVIAKKDGGNPIQEIWDAINSLNNTAQNLEARIEQLEQCACVPCTDTEQICDDGIDNDCDGLTDSDDSDCVPSPCSYCVDGIGDTSLKCYLQDSVWKEGVAQSDYEWYWYYTYGYMTMTVDLTADNGGNYEVCAIGMGQTCPATSDLCEDAGTTLVFQVPGVDDTFWLLVHRKDDTGNPGYHVKTRVEPV